MGYSRAAFAVGRGDRQSTCGRAFWRGGDAAVIDGVLVDGSATLIDRTSAIIRNVQSGLLYHYAFAMIIGLIVLLGALILALR